MQWELGTRASNMCLGPTALVCFISESSIQTPCQGSYRYMSISSFLRIDRTEPNLTNRQKNLFLCNRGRATVLLGRREAELALCSVEWVWVPEAQLRGKRVKVRSALWTLQVFQVSMKNCSQPKCNKKHETVFFFIFAIGR